MTPEALLLGVVAIIFFVSDGMANVLLPRFVVDELGGGEATAGIVMGSAAITALLIRPWFGRLADRRGARRLLMVGALVTAAGYPLLTVASSVEMAIASRLVIGAGRAGVFVSVAVLALQIAPVHRRTEAASYSLVTMHVGLGTGPLAGEAIRNNLSYDWAWLVILLGTVGSAALATRLPVREVASHGEPAPLINRAAIAPGLAMFFGIFTLTGFVTFAPLYGRELGLEDVGLVFTVVSFTMIFMRVVFGRVPDAIGEIPTSTGAVLVTIIAAVVVALWTSPAGMYVGGGLLAVGLSLLSPSLMTLATGLSTERERGSAMATFTAFLDGGSAVVGPVFGLLVSGVSYRSAFLVGAVMAALSLPVLHLAIAPKQATAPAAQPT